MNKLNSDNVNFKDDEFFVKVENNTKNKQDSEISDAKKEAEIEYNNIIQKAKLEANEIINKAKENIELEKKELLEKAKLEANEIINKAKKDAQEIEESIEAKRIEEAKKGYEEGHADGIIKAKEELLDELENEYKEKLSFLDNLSKSQNEIKEKILKSLTQEIIGIIENITKKIILKNIDENVIKNIIDETVHLLEKKENINITLSEEYAKYLYEIQKRKLNGEIDFDFSQFNQFENFKISYSPKFKKDTIIVENLEERFDASIMSQFDIIINNIKDKNNAIKEDLKDEFEKSE